MSKQKTEKKFLGRTEILQLDDQVTEDLHVPEWGGWVRVRALTGAERDQFEGSLQIGRGKKARIDYRNLRAKLVSLAVVDESGQPLFTPQDVRALGQKSSAALDRVFSAAQRLSRITDDDIEDLTQNFTQGQNGNSISG